MKISGYTTVRCAKSMGYPYEQAIGSVLQFADEVVVVDSTNEPDGTTERLVEMSREDPRIKHVIQHYDWSAPNHGVYDFQAKALARSKCTGDYLWQFDADEIVHEDHAKKAVIEKFITVNWKSCTLPGVSSASVFVLPVLDFWGRTKARTDVNFWKWRISENKPNITHGCPAGMSHYVNGLLYALPGTDGCNYIDINTRQPIVSTGYTPSYVENCHRLAPKDSIEAFRFEQWTNRQILLTPAVFHYGWYNIERKVRNYKTFWTGFWKALYNESRDERDNPMFPGRLWSEVSDAEIVQYAIDLETKTSGHVFHKPWDGSCNNGITIKMSHPKIIQPWLEEQNASMSPIQIT